MVRLFDATTTSISASEATPRQTLFNMIESSDIPQDVRFGLALSLLASQSTSLLAEGLLDAIAVEATQAALANDTGPAGLIAADCIGSKGRIHSITEALLINHRSHFQRCHPYGSCPSVHGSTRCGRPGTHRHSGCLATRESR